MEIIMGLVNMHRDEKDGSVDGGNKHFMFKFGIKDAKTSNLGKYSDLWTYMLTMDEKWQIADIFDIKHGRGIINCDEVTITLNIAEEETSLTVQYL